MTNLINEEKNALAVNPLKHSRDIPCQLSTSQSPLRNQLDRRPPAARVTWRSSRASAPLFPVHFSVSGSTSRLTCSAQREKTWTMMNEFFVPTNFKRQK